MAVAAEHLDTSSGFEPDSFEALFDVWRHLDIPSGYRADISEGAILMNPPPAPEHNVVAWRTTLTLAGHVPTDAGLFQQVAIKVPEVEKLYVPDLVAVPIAALGGGSVVKPTDVLMAVEITSPSNARRDRKDKLAAYAQGGVRAYLLIDRIGKNASVTLCTDPADGEYQHVVRVPLGETIHLPEPFDIDLDTAQFPR